MALIKCPECGKEVSSAAKNCPFCGYPIAKSQSNIVQISIDRHPTVFGCVVPIKDKAGQLLLNANAGSVATIKTDKAITIQLCSVFGGCFITTTVQPGKKYRATWGVGLFQPVIQNCFEIDVIDA